MLQFLQYYNSTVTTLKEAVAKLEAPLNGELCSILHCHNLTQMEGKINYVRRKHFTWSVPTYVKGHSKGEMVVMLVASLHHCRHQLLSALSYLYQLMELYCLKLGSNLCVQALKLATIYMTCVAQAHRQDICQLRKQHLSFDWYAFSN